MPTTTGIATSFINFTRASNATVTDSDGRVKWAPTNLLTNSESFDAWSKSQLSVTANSIAAPNGTTTADTIVEDTSTNWHYANRNITFTAGVTYTASAFLRAGTQSYGTINLYNSSTSSLYAAASFNLSTGAVANSGVAGTGYSIVGSPTITPIGSSGWYLCSLTFVAGTTAPEYFSISTSDNGVIGSYGMTSYLGASKTIYAWGAALYRSDLGGMQPNTSAYPMYNPTTPKNLLGYTEDWSNAAWIKSALVPSANQAIAINGLQTADLLREDATSAWHSTYQIATTSANGTYCLSVYLKSAGRQYANVSIASDAANTAWTSITADLIGGTITSNQSGATGTYISSSISFAGDGWYRVSIIGKIGANADGVSSIALSNVANPTRSNYAVYSYTGDGTSGIYLWGAQLSDSASLDPYVPVYGAAVTSAAYYGPRRDFDPVTLACKGLLVEEQRTNLQLNSNVFGTSTFAATVVAGAAASPSGLIDASSLACTSVGGRAILSMSVTSGIVYTFSAFIKAGTNTSAFIELAGTAGSGGAVVFNLSSGTVTSGTGGAIVPAPNGFYRCSVTSTATGTGASDMRIGTGDATSKTVFVYGAQLEANASFATSYIPTGAATATRNADVASVSTQAFPYSATEGTLVANVSTFDTSSNLPTHINLSDGTTSNYIRMNAQPTSYKLRNYVRAGGADVVNSTMGGVTVVNDPFKAGVYYKTNSFNSSVNGAISTEVTTGAAPSAATTLSLGNWFTSAGTFLNGHIRQITYLPRRISNAELQTRTT